MSRRTHRIPSWDPEDPAFWAATGRRVARRNMWASVFAEHIGFCLWSLWSVLVLFMTPKNGFTVSTADKFLLTSLVTLVGALVRPGYGWAVTRLGGRTWTTMSALAMIVPAALALVLMGDPGAPLWAFLLCAAASGLGGGSFASSTTNINFFFPEREKGRALGINAGAGNAGVASVQLIGLLVIGAYGVGHPRVLPAIFIALLLVSATLAWTLMDDLPGMSTGGSVYRAVIRDPHCWAISLLYVGTFGSFIGYGFAFGLVLQDDFGRTPLQAAGLTFIGPLLGSVARPLGGHLADRAGPARVTLYAFAGLLAGTLVVIAASATHALALFTVGFIALFVLSGLGNGSTYAMIPVPYAAAARAAAAGAGTAREGTAQDNTGKPWLAARRKAGAVIAIAGTAGGLGGVAINLALKQSYESAHTARPALFGFLACYAVCAAVTLLAGRRHAGTARAAVAAGAARVTT